MTSAANFLGVGKTFFTFFMFVQIRIKQPDAIIIHMSDDETFIFHSDKTVQLLPTGGGHRKFTDDENNWVIADSVLPQYHRLNCRVVIVSSPKVKYGRYEKHGFQPRCMPLWDEEELRTVHARVYPSVN